MTPQSTPSAPSATGAPGVPDAVLNRVAAQVCGYTEIESPEFYPPLQAGTFWVAPQGVFVPDHNGIDWNIFNPCQDRNVLHTLLLAVQAAGIRATFMGLLREAIVNGLSETDRLSDYRILIDIHCAPCRLQVECALRALGVWPEGQTQEEPPPEVTGIANTDACRNHPAIISAEHTCPYQSEINDDDEYTCFCCQECRQECRDSI